MDMKERLQELAENARKRIEESEGLDKLNDVRVAYLGKKGELTAILKGMKDVAPEERPKVGQLVNETRAKIEELLEASKKDFEEKVREEKMKAEVIDVTLPAKKAKIGHRHPNTIALEEFCLLYTSMDKLAQMTYQETAYEVMSRFLTDFTEDELKNCSNKADDSKFDTEKIAPLHEADGAYFLELFHGATIAFKDMALSILPHLMTTAAKKNNVKNEIVILTATSVSYTHLDVYKRQV